MTTAAPQICEPQICEVGGKGNFLPLFRDNEQEWPRGLRIILYLFGLLWAFMGVAIVADVFMGAIERITSKKRRVTNKATGRPVTVKVWNDTVANLTLMALGSSAPEILLSVIELLTNDFLSGDLGPSTIVGSAAFNLLCITAVCISAIGNGDIRLIKDTHVFAVTVFFSLFAYLWLFFIVTVSTPHRVQIWEGAITFLAFPALVVMAFMADKGYFSSATVREEATHRRVSIADISKEELAAAQMQIINQHKDDTLTDERLAKLLQLGNQHRKTRAAYKVQAVRAMFGGKRVGEAGEKSNYPTSVVVPFEGSSELLKDDINIEFASPSYAVLESVGTLKIQVRRLGNKEQIVLVDYKTRDGTAKADSDYEPKDGTLQFDAGEDSKQIDIQIIDDLAYEDDEEFYVDLTNVRCKDPNYEAVLGQHPTARIAIVDDDEPGVLSFEKELLTVQEGTEKKTVTASVQRKNGSKGKISCKYKTEEASALEGLDYESLAGTLTFACGQTSATVKLTILPRGRYETKEEFRLILYDVTDNAKFDASTDGGADECICTVVIESDASHRGRVDRVMQVLQMDWDRAQIGHHNWKDQFRSAILVNGGEEGEPPSILDWISHVLTIFWKVLFAFIPPADFCDGWACFGMALAMIGLVTALIGDLAGLLGCVLDIPGPITAITFVALGTSLPDTFASKTAAEQDPYADASIGNVTGSNSVNVFLGLGLPWLIGGFYWAAVGKNDKWDKKYSGHEVLTDYPDLAKGGNFLVIGGDLGFSVIVFTACAVACIALLLLRRKLFGGELGGPAIPKFASSAFLVFLWFLYVGLSSWKVLDSDDKC